MTPRAPSELEGWSEGEAVGGLVWGTESELACWFVCCWPGCVVVVVLAEFKVKAEAVTIAAGSIRGLLVADEEVSEPPVGSELDGAGI